MPAQSTPIARGPLLELHRAAGAKIATEGAWQIASEYPREPDRAANVLVDLAHWTNHEINGPQTEQLLRSLCGADVPLRAIHVQGNRHAYRLTPTRAIVFNADQPPEGAIDVTGGWATLALSGSDGEAILNKVTAVDLRPKTLPVGSCCQGPIFGVNTLFGRYANHILLHVCPDSAQFFWEVLADAGQEFNLQPAGTKFWETMSSP